MWDYDQNSGYELAPPLRHSRSRSRSKLSRRLKKIRKQVAAVVNWRLVLPLVISALVIVVIGGLTLLTSARKQVQTSLDGLEYTLQSLDKPGSEWTLTDFDRVQGSLQDVIRTLSSVQSQARLVRPLLSWQPEIHNDALALDATLELARSADELLTGLEPTLFFLVDGEDTESVVGGLSSGERIIELLRIGQGRFTRAQGHLDNAATLLASLDAGSLSTEMFLNLETLNGHLHELEEITTLLLNAPNLLTTALGLAEEQRYLVLAQNSDILRPSGGYVSARGWLTVRLGNVTDFGYTADAPEPPPADMASEVQVPDWWLVANSPLQAAWNGSWYADFPSTAALAQWYYDNGDNGPPATGIIGIDLVGFEYLLTALQQVRVPSYDVTVTPDTFRQVVYTIGARDGAPLGHERFLAALYEQIFAAWKDHDQAHNAALLGAALKALQEKHLMLYFADDNLNAAVDILGWSGRQAPATDHDYLMVADANLGGQASNRSIIRQTTYDVTLEADGRLNSRVSVAYNYPDYLAAADPAIASERRDGMDYNNLIQIFAPRGSTIGQTANLFSPVETVTEDTHTAFVTAFQVPYDSSRRYQISYATPALVETLGPYHRYRLLIQKQPGRLAENVNVTVALPANARVIYTAPEPLTRYNLDQPVLEFQFNLTKDEWLELIYTPTGLTSEETQVSP